MTTGRLAASACVAAALLSSARAGAAPLDLANTSARQIRVEIETSTDAAFVGATFGTPIPAAYAVAGGLGTVTIAGEDYEAWAATPGLDASDIVFRIDLASREVELVSASGSFSSVHAAYTFVWEMDSERSSGFVQASGVAMLHCSSQAELDALCPVAPPLCGATCVVVPGAPYDPATGKLNMVGLERQDGCGETGCLVVDLFNPKGDLRLSEAPATPVPAAGPLATLALTASLLLLGLRRLRAPSRGLRRARD